MVTLAQSQIIFPDAMNMTFSPGNTVFIEVNFAQFHGWCSKVFMVVLGGVYFGIVILFTRESMFSKKLLLIVTVKILVADIVFGQNMLTIMHL